MADKREMIFRNLSQMLAAGVPIVKALRTAGGVSWGYRRAYNRVAAAAEAGSTMADAMEKNKRRFRVIDTHLIRVGEESGGLPRILRGLADYYEVLNRVRRKIRGGVLFPLLQFHFVAVFVPAVLYLMNTLSQGKMGMEKSSAILVGCGILSVLYVPAAIYFLIARLTPQTGLLRYALDFVLNLLPPLNVALRNMAYARYFRNFHLCLLSGMPIVSICELSLKATGNGVIAQKFKGGEMAAREGKDVSEGFKGLPDELHYSWVNGELTGDLDIVTDRLARLCTERAEVAFELVARTAKTLVYVFVAMVIVYCIIIILSQIGAAYSQAVTG